MAGPSYLHGVEIISITKGVRPITVVRSGVIALVGTAPKQGGATQTLYRVSSDTDVAAFGEELPGFTIPQALRAIYENQVCTVLVVNVYVEATHAETVALEAVVLANGKFKLAFPPVQAGQGSTVALFQNDGTTAVTWVYGTDYTIDDYGNFVALTTVPTAGNYKATYKKFVPGNVTSSNIIGAVTSGVRTGMKKLQESYATYGFKPMILICPGYDTATAVVAEMISQASNLGIPANLINAPTGTLVADAITGRGPSGAINFNVADKNTVLCYPMVKAYDEYTNANQNRWYTPYLAGVMNFVHLNEGYWVSPSNHSILGIVGTERLITYDPTDKTGTTDANQLNAAGIVTIANSFGTGFLVWGNRNSGFPTSTDVETFIPVKVTRAVVEGSIQLGAQPYVDKPLDLPGIDNIVETVNAFIRTLISRKALLSGSRCYFDPANNSDAQLAAGQAVFSIDMMSPTPGERLTFLSALDTSLLAGLLGTT